MDILILFYNTMWGFPLEFRKEDLPGGCVITTDRNLLAKADAVVFHLPDLPSVMEDEIDKREGQLWVGWSLECEENYSWTKNPEFRESFDLWMGYHQEDDIVILIMDRIMGRCWLRHGGKSLIRRRHVCLFRVI